eukprot:g13715.t1
MRGANPKDRVPLSTLQLLEAEVLQGYQCLRFPAARLDGKRETRSNAGHPDVWNAPVEDAEAKALKGRPDGPGRLPSYLRPRQAPEVQKLHLGPERRNASKQPRRQQMNKEVRKLQRAQSVF